MASRDNLESVIKQIEDKAIREVAVHAIEEAKQQINTKRIDKKKLGETIGGKLYEAIKLRRNNEAS